MNYSTMPTGLPTPNGAIRKLPVVIRDRMPNVPMPVEYEAACKALAACASIDEGKYWSDKSDALAAWAKIYKSTEAATAARRLKLKAFRRMGELATELQPSIMGNSKGRPQRAGAQPGARALLCEAGLSKGNAGAALQLSRLPKEKFAESVNRGDGLSRATIAARGLANWRSGTSPATDTWLWLTRASGVSRGAQLTRARSAFRNRHPYEAAAGISPGEVKMARELAVELIEWLDAFEQALPKVSGETEDNGNGA